MFLDDEMSLEIFISDCLSEINEHYKNYEKESLENPDDKFLSGHSLAYREVYEIIQNRAEIYGIKPEDEDD